MAVTEITRRKALLAAGAVFSASWLDLAGNTALANIADVASAVADDQSEFWTLARELVERCKDFARLDAIYGRSDIAWAYYDDAYLGIVDTAKHIHWSEQQGQREDKVRRWVSTIYPDDIDWVLRREMPIEGLSARFANLNRAFDHSTRVLADWSAMPMNPMQMRHEKLRASWKVVDQFSGICRSLRVLRAVTQGDRALKRRAIEHNHCGLGGRIAKAKYTCGFDDVPSREDLAVAVNIYKSRGFHLLSCKPDWREWQWVYA